jgi:hypothetical protein
MTSCLETVPIRSIGATQPAARARKIDVKTPHRDLVGIGH